MMSTDIKNNYLVNIEGNEMGNKKCTIEILTGDVVFVLNHIINFGDGDQGNDIAKVIPLNDGKAEWEFEKDATHALVIVGIGRAGTKVTLKIEELNINVDLFVRYDRSINELIAFNVF